jgi:hypothetical protein
LAVAPDRRLRRARIEDRSSRGSLHVKVTIAESLSDETRAAWERFWRTAKHAHPRQHFVLGGVETAKDRRTLFFTAERDGALVGVAALMVRSLLPGRRAPGEANCLSGPAFDDLDVGREFVREIVARLRALSVGRVRLSPAWYYPDAEPVRAMLQELGFVPLDASPRRQTGLVDVTRTPDEIIASFTTSTRRDIRQVERKGVVVRPLTEASECALALQSFAALRARRGLAPIDRREFEDTFERVLRHQDLGALLGAWKDSQFLGAITLYRSTSTTHVSHYAVEAGLGRELSNMSIGPILWWQACLWAKAKGCGHLDVEGGVKADDPKSPMFEIENFKRRFAPQPVERLDEHVLVCNPLVWAFHRGAIRLANGKNKMRAAWQRLFTGGPRGRSRARTETGPAVGGERGPSAS